LDVVVLDTGNCAMDQAACNSKSSSEATYLTNALAGFPAADCVVVDYAISPFSAYDHGDLYNTYMSGVWQAMFDNSISASRLPDLVMAGHDHEYQRFRAMDSMGEPATSNPSVPLIVVGTGGDSIVSTVATLGDHQTTADDHPATGGTDLAFGAEKLAYDTTSTSLTAKFYEIGSTTAFDTGNYTCNT
jgi:hypothetical protein